MSTKTKEQISKNMKAVHNKDSKIELMLRKELWNRGLRYRKNYRGLIGKPDIVFIGKKIAIFCDSEFWHGFDWETKKHEIKSRQEFWIPKIERTIERDKEVTGEYTSTVIVVYISGLSSDTIFTLYVHPFCATPSMNAPASSVHSK